MKTIYFVRHGESGSNAGLEAIGSDPSLTEKGKKQAQFIAERCSHLLVELILSSDMKRALETASVIKEKINKPHESSELFAERRGPSEFQHVLEPEWDKVRKTLGPKYLYEHGYHYSDEENFEDLLIRAEKAITLIKNRPEKHIVVVTHGSFLRDMLSLMIFKEHLTPRIRRCLTKGMVTTNTGLTLVHYDENQDQWSMLTWNDHAHLAE